MTTVGEYMMRKIIPAKYLPASAPLTKRNINKALADYAREEPDEYVKNVVKLKKLGDAVSTYEGISVGLDDISPEPARDRILKPLFNKIKKTKDPRKKVALIGEMQKKMLPVAAAHKGDLGIMVRSGGRGNAAQLMRTVATPAGVTDWDNNIVPWAIKRSFSEGLRPDEYWATTTEARKLSVMSNNSVTEPGEMGKMLAHTMSDQVITVDDCGTHNGLHESIKSPRIIDRFLATRTGPFDRNTLITSKVINTLHKAKVSSITARSPLTCEAAHGICSYCYGVDVYGKRLPVGTNVGMRSAQALSEPLTQAMLSSKHGVRVAEDRDLSGLEGMRLLVNVPKTFPNAAVISKDEATVDKIESAPQGGKYIYVNKSKYYVSPLQKTLVREGDLVTPGQPLSSGIPKPDDIVKTRGLGPGRLYYANKLYKVFNDTISDVDPRHTEVLAKAHINYGTVTEDPTDKLVRGDTVSYSALKKFYLDNRKEVPINQVKSGDILADNYNEYLAGSVIDAKAKKELKSRGVKRVFIAGSNTPRVQYIMKPLTHAPLQDPDWLARLSHRNLKSSILRGAALAEESNIHSYNPVAGYIYGAEFGNGPDGTY